VVRGPPFGNPHPIAFSHLNMNSRVLNHREYGFQNAILPAYGFLGVKSGAYGYQVFQLLDFGPARVKKTRHTRYCNIDAPGRDVQYSLMKVTYCICQERHLLATTKRRLTHRNSNVFNSLKLLFKLRLGSIGLLQTTVTSQTGTTKCFASTEIRIRPQHSVMLIIPYLTQRLLIIPYLTHRHAYYSILTQRHAYFSIPNTAPYLLFHT
jgi:hypothetical protein